MLAGSFDEEKQHATSQMPALASEYLAPYSQLELNQPIVWTLPLRLFLLKLATYLHYLATRSLSQGHIGIVQASAPYHYPDAYYTGMVGPYGAQAVVHSMPI